MSGAVEQAGAGDSGAKTGAGGEARVVAVDGGGTKCRVAICGADGRPLAQATGGAANVSSDFAGALAEITATIDRARREAGLSEAALGACPAWLGLAGAIDAAMCERVARALPFARCRVTDDRPTAMAGALGARPGCIVAAGTGSFLGRQADGASRFVGGWGLQLSDQASGAWLGRGLLRAVIDWQDGMRGAAPLLERTLADFGSVRAVVEFSLVATPADYARLAPGIVAAAKDRDPAAEALMREGADWIGAGLRRLGWRQGEAICPTGGVGPHYAAYLPADLATAIAAPQGSELDGAIRLALSLREKG